MKVKNVGFNSIQMTTLDKGYESPTNSSYWYGDEMIGSADTFGVGFDNLFVVATSRSGTCETLKDILSHCNAMDDDVMAPDSRMTSIERFYLELDTGTGPLIDELLQ